MYSEDDLLPLSGLQHLAFCERQWALIHVERMWEENRLTADGRVLHERVHEQAEEKRHDLLIVRGLPIHSLRLGLSGQADVVQFGRVSDSQTAGTAQLEGRPGWWSVKPVEYKRGRAKREACDRVQLCAQALCLEEMFQVSIADGSLYYGETRRRTAVRFDPGLRQQTEGLAGRMHALFRERATPPAILKPGCASCSLKEKCLPELAAPRKPVGKYFERWLSKEIA